MYVKLTLELCRIHRTRFGIPVDINNVTLILWRLLWHLHQGFPPANVNACFLTCRNRA